MSRLRLLSLPRPWTPLRRLTRKRLLLRSHRSLLLVLSSSDRSSPVLNLGTRSVAVLARGSDSSTTNDMPNRFRLTLDLLPVLAMGTGDVSCSWLSPCCVRRTSCPFKGAPTTHFRCIQLSKLRLLVSTRSLLSCIHRKCVVGGPLKGQEVRRMLCLSVLKGPGSWD